MTIQIVQDENPESPREWDNLGKMICFHSRYRLGDKHDVNHKDYGSWGEMKSALSKEYAVLLPLYLYDHGGISMSVGSFIGRAQHAEWDSGQVGYIGATRKEILENYGGKKLTKDLIDKATDCLKGEVETYDSYLRGEVYGYRILGDKGEVIDSCYGYYSEEDAKKEAEYMVDLYEKQTIGMNI